MPTSLATDASPSVLPVSPPAAPGVRASRRVPGTVPAFLVACVVGVVASAYTVSSGTNLDYGDAMAHLTIAQRITDGRSPGLVQLGTVWLPVPHLLLLPLVQNQWLFHTGVAACVLGTLCLGASAAALHRIMARLQLGPTARVVGLVVLLANPSLLYVGTTALTEPVLIAALLMCIAGLAGWAFAPRRLSGGELAVFAGLPAAMGVLTRYEAWALVISGSVFVAIVVLRRGDGIRRAGLCAACFAAPAAMAIGWWLGYNLAIYGNPVEFLTGEYSAAAFADVYAESGRLTTAGNLGLSVKVLGWSLVQNVGLVGLVGAGIGLLVMTWRWGLDDRALVVWLAGTSTAFLLVSLVGGQHVMVNAVSLPEGATYNNRYVLSAVPWVALLCAVLVGQVRGRRLVVAASVGVLAAVGAQQVWWAGDPGARMSVIEEANIQHEVSQEVRGVARWIGAHYDGGGLLMDESSLLVAPVIGIDHGDYVNRATGPLFDRTLADPYAEVRWVFMHADDDTVLDNASSVDRVTVALREDPAFNASYAVVHQTVEFVVYRRVGEPS